ncbi:glycosyl hydrolase family 28-related protein [Thalassobius sp. I31.1]|uniref:glycosyl hydrolase family 28-related protein n=1 Tax=Thalassobius sp. I31.1 TaxID=2109912 RepID=UPI000D1B6A92|nr:glycosyl hydrolase family 28-related protein [Thalassobius sp. I31.1]
MNKAVTDGLVLMPPKFRGGLDVWSSGDGTPGSDTYNTSPTAAFVPADADFSGCLELLKLSGTQKIRYMGETPILPGCYLQIKTRVKVVSGALPSVRVAGWAGTAGNSHVAGLPETGPSVTITGHGEVFEVSAIVGTGTRGGVDMPWGREPVYGHFGIDITGPNGAIVRVDDIQIEDISNVFVGKRLDTVDVVDYGAIGDGVTDNMEAFEAADAAANGRKVVIPEGNYLLSDHVTFENPTQFTGTVAMPTDKRLTLTKDYHLPAYIDAFGDEVEALKRAIAVLFNFSDHESLDLGGRQITLTEPIDVQAAVGNKTTYKSRRVIRNGMLDCAASAGWDDEVVTSIATYSVSDNLVLSNVANIAAIPVGARVSGNGVGREIYVREVNVSAQEVTLSQPLYDAAGTQNYTFTRHKYALDFSGFTNLSRFVLSDIEFLLSKRANGVMLATGGLVFHVRDCFFTQPKDKGVTSPGRGCQGMLIDRCQFFSGEGSLAAQSRVSIAFNSNANDNKIRDNRSTRFAHFGIVGGGGHIFANNHWFQGDDFPDGLRMPGVIIALGNCTTTFVGNYVDNSFIEWSNEYDSHPGFQSENSFGGLTISDNVFIASNVAPWFNWIVVKPYGGGHFIHGMNVSGNVFKALSGQVDQVDKLDSSFASLDFGRCRNLRWEGNTYTAVTKKTHSPAMVEFDQATDSKTWTVDFEPHMPFGGRARNVMSVTAEGAIMSGGSQATDMPYVTPETGPDKDQVKVTWANPSRGRIHVVARVDNPN